jgi:DNA-binding GntR family transcriptional regulator
MLAAELAAARITLSELETVEAMHTRMLAHFEVREKEPYFALNNLIHRGILKAAAIQF